MRRLIVATGALALAAFAVQPAAAQVRFGANANFATDTDFGLGAKLNFGVGNVTENKAIEGQATFDIYFPDGYDYWTIAANGLYSLKPTGSVVPQLGAGLGVGRSSVSVLGVSASSTDVFLNLIGAIKFRPSGSIQPFAEARFQIGDGSQLVLGGGLYFGKR
ncbi:MAG: hypothetical protein AB7L66_10775 [Gemmatimonadales bacterium]